ncbi:hypothetical protein TNCV_885081 [Trichonephila clavipes]|nr:hypothetical protein TNCV_885081 [Trichonephila clavipes]
MLVRVFENPGRLPPADEGGLLGLSRCSIGTEGILIYRDTGLVTRKGSLPTSTLDALLCEWVFVDHVDYTNDSLTRTCNPYEQMPLFQKRHAIGLKQTQ